MIQLNKERSSQPTQEEIQNYVNSVYKYAADLYVNHNMSWQQVRVTLIHEGLSDADANTIIENLKSQKLESKSSASNKELGYGALWAIGGIAATAISDGTVIFWGAVVWGVWLIIKGIYHKVV